MLSIKNVWQSLIFRSLLLLILFISVLMGGLAYWFVHTQRTSLLDAAFKKNKEETIRISQIVEQEMSRFGNQLALLAKTSSIVALDSVDSPKFLKNFDVSSLFISGEYVSLYNKNRQLICDNIMTGSVSNDRRNFTEFEKINQIRPYLTDWYWENNSPKKIFAIEVGDRVHASGSLTAAFSFRRIWQKYSSYAVGNSGFLVIVSPDNRILMHPQLNLAIDGKHFASELGLPKIDVHNKYVGDSVKVLTLKDGEKYTAAFTYNTQYKFGIWTLQPIKEVESSVATVISGFILMLLILYSLLILVTILLFVRFAKPLHRLIAHINFISDGHFVDAEQFSTDKRNDEIGMLSKAFNRMLLLIQKQIIQLNEHQKYLELQVQKRTKELEDAKNQLDIISRTDELTGLPNRRDLREKIMLEASRSGRMHRDFCFAFIDIDKFKSINDTYGHNCGDVVLQRIANEIRQLLRKYDFVARWGGEEFLCMLPETELFGATIVAERIRKAVEKLHIEYGDQVIPVTITVGVSLYDSKLGPDRSIQLADQALYKGKTSGRNRVVVHDPSETTDEDYREAALERERAANVSPQLNCTCPIDESSERRATDQKAD